MIVFLLNRGTKGFLKQLAKINRGCHRGCPEAKHPIRDMVEDGTYQYTGVWRERILCNTLRYRIVFGKGNLLLARRSLAASSFIHPFIRSFRALTCT